MKCQAIKVIGQTIKVENPKANKSLLEFSTWGSVDVLKPCYIL